LEWQVEQTSSPTYFKGDGFSFGSSDEEIVASCEGGGDQPNVAMTPTIIIKLMRAITHRILVMGYCGGE